MALLNQEGGFYWDYISEKNDKSRIFNLSPSENFIRTTYWYNYLIHAEKVISFENIENENLKKYLDEIKENLFNKDIPIQLYKQYLPIEYNKKMSKLLFSRNIINPKNGTVDKLVGFSGLMVRDPKLDELDLYLNLKDSNNQKNLRDFNNQDYQDIIGYKDKINAKLYKFNSNIKGLIKNKTLIPCVLIEDESNWLSNKFNDEYEKKISGSKQSTYGDLIKGKDKKKRLPEINKKISAMINYDTNLYWIDLFKLRFKHTKVDNEGNINTSSDYTIISNIKKIKKDKHFYTRLMRKVTFSTGEKSITPLTVFLMDDMLYSHDHKRIVASIAAGNRYMIGVINQNANVIIPRELGYRPMKCVFSQNDKSIILRFTDEQLKDFGHYFFIIGDDETPFMKTINNTTFKKRNVDLLRNKEVLLKNEYLVNPHGSIRTLHNNCVPTIFQYLDRNNFLKEWYLKKLKYTIYKITEVQKKLNELPEKSFSSKYLVNSSYYLKYMKYKNKYLALKKLVGGTLSTSEINKYIKEIFESSSEDKGKILAKINDEERKQITTALINDHIQNFLKYTSKAKNTILEQFNEIEKKLIKTAIKAMYSKNRELAKKNKELAKKNKKLQKKSVKKTKKLIEKPKKIIYKLLNHKLPKSNIINLFINSTIRRNIERKELLDIIDNFINYFKSQILYLNQDRTNEELLKWEINNIGNSFWYIFNVKEIHSSIKNLLDMKYPFLRKSVFPTLTPPFCNIFFSLKKNVNKGPIRYSKTPHPELEDMVLLFRTALGKVKSKCTTTEKYLQLYSAKDIVEWQENEFKDKSNKSTFPYLKKSVLTKIYPSSDGILNDDLITLILKKQTYDHQRIFKMETDNGIKYGAYQGLSENMIYQNLKEVPNDMKFSIHLGKRNILESILSKKSLPGNNFNQTPLTGHLDLLGRYIHAFGYVEKNMNGGFRLIPKFWNPFKNRLYCRFKTRVGVVIDMEKLKSLYDKKNIAWNKVCGINDIGTIIFFKPVPPEALIARNRKAPYEENPGIPYEMEEMWGIRII